VLARLVAKPHRTGRLHKVDPRELANALRFPSRDICSPIASSAATKHSTRSPPSANGLVTAAENIGIATIRCLRAPISSLGAGDALWECTFRDQQKSDLRQASANQVGPQIVSRPTGPLADDGASSAM
jgi:hypothetical protein